MTQEKMKFKKKNQTVFLTVGTEELLLLGVAP